MQTAEAALRKSKKRIGRKTGVSDFPLIVMVMILVIFGIVMVFSASYYYSINRTGSAYSYLIRQSLLAAVGVVAMIVMSRLDYHLLRRFYVPLAFIAMLLLLLIFTPLGVTVNGATRWLDFKYFTLMPGELAKPAVIVLCASYFSRDMRRARNLRGLLPVAVYALAAAALIYKQPNLSTAITVFVIAFSIAFVAGMQWRYVLLLSGGLGAGIAYIAFVADGYQHDRVVSFLDPFKDALGDGFQVVQSLLALGTGGFRGLGLGKSIQKNLYLPEPQNDFILAIIGEELGFIGIALLLILYALVVWRIFYIGLKSRDDLGMLLCSGTAIMIGVQVVLNGAVVTSSMPPTGIALPFVSYGGNSIVILMALIGVVLSVSRRSAEESEAAA